MTASDIVIKGAREHNLRDVDVVIPRNRLVCLTGVSGSGKSSLAFDTLYSEGQRRYIESLSSFARQFLGQMPKPDVDFIGGLSPSISISQKTGGQNPRSTVGTITEIHDYLRVLFARCGQGHCPRCHRPVTAQTKEQILQRIRGLEKGTRYQVLAPLVRGQKGEFRDLCVDLLKQGFVRARVDGEFVALSDKLQLDRQMRHYIEVVIDRLEAGAEGQGRLSEAVELALKMGEGSLIVAAEKTKPRSGPRGKKTTTKTASEDLQLSAHYACTSCGISFEPPSPQLFSFNSPQGMCLTCAGLGEVYGFVQERLITHPSKSLKQGCIELLGSWKDLGRWRRHIYQGVADTWERLQNLPEGTMLETAWEELAPELQEAWLWGTGDEHITFTWKQGSHVHKYGGNFEGLIPAFMSKHRNSRSKIQRRKLEEYMSVVACQACQGARLNPQATAVTLSSRAEKFESQPRRSLPELCQLSIAEAARFFSDLDLSGAAETIAEEPLKEIRGRLKFLENVGLDYLTLDRSAPTLSGGEAQRIRLAGQIGSGLVGVLYILDEPSIGLHPRDNDRLLDTLRHLRDMGNTVVVVEHDEDTMLAADHIIDFGPGPGTRGGKVVVSGDVEKVATHRRSLTGQYLSGKRAIPLPAQRRDDDGPKLGICGARHNNLRGVDVEIPLGKFVCVTGVSGSGKSSLVNGILVEALRRDLNRGEGKPGEHDRIEGLDNLDKLIAIDQSPIGRTPRSNPATYIKVFDDIRKLYAQLQEAKTRGFAPGRFSFNVVGGRCEACQGNGSNRLEMDFLADVWVTCPVCRGQRFNHETLQVCFKGKSIAEVLEMDVAAALEHFQNLPAIHHKLQTLHNVGLDYLQLGQPSPTLSGGEAQRIKLARELVKKSTGRTLYLLDEPTTGLHFADIEKLLSVLAQFVEAGNTVLVIEHNLDVIKTADWVIDLGPEGGDAGGRIVATGTPEQVAQVSESYTGKALAKILNSKKQESITSSKKTTKQTAPTNGEGNDLVRDIFVRGARQHNLKEIDVSIPRDQMTVCCGPSGSGKTSLAMDTIYAEGQRRYVESLSSYARQFVGQMQKPRYEHIEGLSPAIAIEQKHLGHTPRSTVGTVTEIYDYLRILMARLGVPYCPECDIPIGTQTTDEIIDKVLTEPEGTRLYLMAPIQEDVLRSGNFSWEELRSAGYIRARVNGRTYSLDEDPPTLDRRRRHVVEVIVDRVTVRKDARSRIADSVENSLALGHGVMHVAQAVEDTPEERWPHRVHSLHYACEECGRSFEPLSPHNFSFNSSLGWCESCQGLGTQTGTNQSALFRDPQRSLIEGALRVWPEKAEGLFLRMLTALSRHTGVPIDVPFQQLSPRQRRTILQGTGDEWIDMAPEGKKGPAAKTPEFRFQYKGVYPALEEASRLSPGFRARLENFVGDVQCMECGGSRLREDAAAVRFHGQTIQQLCHKPLGELAREIKQIKLDTRERRIAGELLREVRQRLEFLVQVGLEYLTLHRGAATLSGGESQRIRLASQVGSGLSGVLYVLDEPTIGLHPRDNLRLLDAIRRLRDLGNTLLVVEHDREVVAGADQLLDFGPAAGDGGGRIVARGTPETVQQDKSSVTGPFLSGEKAIPVPTSRRMLDTSSKAKTGRRKKSAKLPDLSQLEPPQGWLEIVAARHNNLKNIDIHIPLGTFTVITGVSGSGKSSLANDVLYAALARTLHRAQVIPGDHDQIRGLEFVNKVIRVDQRPLGQSPTSNPATYTGVFDLIRALFAQMPESKIRGFTQRRFSFNVPGGRCEACEGNGQRKIEMHFLPDVWVECEACQGKRYDAETLAVKFHGHSIADVLELTCGKARQLFDNIPKIRRILQTLCDVGLDYVKLGQAAPTLSGGEAQRVKLATELSRPDTGRTIYLLDEPTTGLHFEDLVKLLDVLNRLVDLGNTVVVIEHNLDVIKTADWMIDLGPEAGAQGGKIVAAGPPEHVVAQAKSAARAKRSRAKNKDTAIPERSVTGEILEAVLAQGPHAERSIYDFSTENKKRKGDLEINEVGQTTKMPWETNGRQWHTQSRVSRNGQSCRWDGKVLDEVVRYVETHGDFAPTEWGQRSVVEIHDGKAGDGWFFHALTGEEWLLRLKFRVAKNTFNRHELVERLQLVPLDDMPELPIYGGDPRVRCKNLQGPWQEVRLAVHSWEETNRPEFWQFLDQAIAGYQKLRDKARENPEDLMPWKKLGRKWHFSRKGFPPGRKVAWDMEVLEELCEMLTEAAPRGQFLWNSQQVVHYLAPKCPEPWATIHTKRSASVEVQLHGPAGKFALGQVADLAREREISTTGSGREDVRLKFTTIDDLGRGELAEFLTFHRKVVAKHHSRAEVPLGSSRS